MYIASIAVTLAAAVAIVVLTLSIYLKRSQKPKNIGKRYYSVLFIGVLYAITVVVRLVCVGFIASFDNTIESFSDGVIKVINTIYVTAGGLTFEGQEADAGLAPIFVIIYYGSILWLAASFIFIVTLGLSYEMSSRIRLFFRKFRAKNIYIFTAVTEDTLVLASSIEDHHEGEKIKPLIIFASNELEPYDKDNELHRKIMARGYIYQCFYKAKDKSLEMPLIDKLGLVFDKRHPFKALLKKKIKVFALENDSKEYGLESKNSDVVFDDIDEMIRMEFLEKGHGRKKRIENRIDENDIVKFIQKNIDRKAKNLKENEKVSVYNLCLQYIDYYLLSNSTINYEFYDEVIIKKLREIIAPELLQKEVVINDNKVYLEDNKDPKLTLYTYIKSLFQIHVVNESYLAGEDLINKRREIQIEDIKLDVEAAKNNQEYRYKRFAINRIKVVHEDEGPLKVDNKDNIKVKPYVNNLDKSKLSEKEIKRRLTKDFEYRNKIEKKKGEKRFNTLILGFGQTGQMALNNLFVDTVSLEPSLPEKGFNLDRYIPSRFVGYVYDLRMNQNIGIFAQTHPSYLVKKTGKSKNENTPFFNYEELVEFYGKDYPGKFSEIDELLKFPFVYASEKNCKDLDFLEDIDGGTGNLNDKTTGKTLGKINAIVICLGSDEENIKVANAILQNVRQELYNSDYTNTLYFYQTIFVNIRDEKNIGRLNWNDAIENKRHHGITVRAFGNREDMYSYRSIIDDERYVKVNNIYNSIDEYFGEIDPNFSLTGKEKNKRILDPTLRSNLTERIMKKNEDMDGSRIRFLRISDYKKASNKNSALFSDYTSAYINSMGMEELDKFENGKLWKYLSFLEHHRWNRYNMSCGYIYSKTFVDHRKSNKEDYEVYSEFGHDPVEYSKSHLKIHKCLLPNSYPNMKYLDDKTECYDYGNVLCASLIASAEEKNKN